MGWLCCKKSPEVIEGGKRIDLTDLYADPVVMFQKRWVKKDYGKILDGTIFEETQFYQTKTINLST